MKLITIIVIVSIIVLVGINIMLFYPLNIGYSKPSGQCLDEERESIFNQIERDDFVDKCNSICGRRFDIDSILFSDNRSLERYGACFDKCSPYINFDPNRFEYYKLGECSFGQNKEQGGNENEI